MKYTGTIVQVQRTRSGVTLIVKTEIGLRGVELDRDLWGQILADFKVEQDEAVIWWSSARILLLTTTLLTMPIRAYDEER